VSDVSSDVAEIEAGLGVEDRHRGAPTGLDAKPGGIKSGTLCRSSASGGRDTWSLGRRNK
jgi:hypothetical protein